MSSSTLGHDLLTVVARLNRWATREAELEVLPARARLLAQLDELGPARIGDLARADHCSQPTMTGQVQRLAAAGLVTRHPDPEDGRAALVALSPTGRAALAKLRLARSAVVAPLVARLDPDDQQAVRSVVSILERLLEATNPAGTSDTDHPHQQQES